MRTLVVETRKEPGAKIRVSGGARCNVLPSAMEWNDFHTRGSMNVVRNVLQSWPLEQVRSFFEHDLAIPLKVEETGKVFPASEDPREVVVGLLSALARSGAQLVGGFRIAAIRIQGKGDERIFELECDDGRKLLARSIAIASGGLSLPKTGSDGHGFEFARALGHAILPLHPALVPLLAGDSRFSELAGVSLPVRLNVLRDAKRIDSQQGDFLFTHKGFSGPVALDVSWHFAAEDGANKKLEAAWLGDGAPAWEALLSRGGKQTLASVLREHLPRRLALVLLQRAGLDLGWNLERGAHAVARGARQPELFGSELAAGLHGQQGLFQREVAVLRVGRAHERQRESADRRGDLLQPVRRSADFRARHQRLDDLRQRGSRAGVRR